MSVALICASHTPMLLKEDFTDAEVCRTTRASFARLAEFVDNFEPDQIIQFSPDHFHGFRYDNMPSFCVGAAATSYGDYGTGAGPLPVNEDFALDMLVAVRDADVDAAVSFDMVVDHGFVQIWNMMYGRFDKWPIVPIFINCIAWPIPAYRRARLLGEAVGRFAAASGKRVLFAASGGLSHDPVVPQIRGAEPALRARLTSKTILTPEEQTAREIQVHAAAKLAMVGEGPVRPLNPEWDRHFLQLLAAADWPTLDNLTPEAVQTVGGSGGNENLCWVAAAAALATAGRYEVVQQDYLPVPGWVAGMAHLAAVPIAQQ